MNNKGQLNLGLIIMAFIGVIVGLALLVSVASSIGESTTSGTYNSSTGGAYTIPADGVTIDLEGQELLGTPTVHESDNLTTINSGNYTIDEGVSTSTGVKSIQYTASGDEYVGIGVNITYDYGPDGYIENAGARSIVSLILIFMGLGIAVIALTPSLRSGVLELAGR